jgi:LacI family transcriptional regulator
VLVARSVPGHQTDYVGADNVLAGRLVGEHLAAINVTSVAFVGGFASTARSDRLHGLTQVLGEAAVPVLRDLALPSPGRQSGADLLAALLAEGGCPDAIVAYNDMYAFGIVNGLRAHGIEPGRDVAVASFDDVPDAAAQQPGLTSAAGFPERVGAEAARLLMDRLEDPSRPPRHVLISPRLSVRESTTLWGQGLPAPPDQAKHEESRSHVQRSL